MQSLLDWLVTLSPGTLYAVMSSVALLENLFPPFPSDVVLAFGSFVAAQGTGTAIGVFLATWVGSVSGAMIVYALGRKYGADRVERRMGGKHAQSTDARLRSLFLRYGEPAVFISRFIPGVRALVPVVAGALRLPKFRTAAMIAIASGIWYGLITYTAFRVGADWPRLRQAIGQLGSTATLIAVIVVLLAVAAWLFVRLRRKAS
ncbi:MAG TPA: DedA family protein [Gemmatimonadaceae bacterium]|nr:DedA family protein [Gemmatimonadaceae bacterium]